ncbi:MAG: ATP-binding protein [Candidatus Dadabacteria bacterium]|nr:MAG: ATP-binding protein [Candidatus Dadabacteria bacterium]
MNLKFCRASRGVMLTRVITSALYGVQALPVEVEVHARVNSKFSRFTIIGLGDGAVRESRDRIQSAIRQSGFEMPKNILVNLAPAEMKKEGASFDLPIAVAILRASGQVKCNFDNISVLGELALDGSVKPIRGAIAHAISAVEQGMDSVVVPAANWREVRQLKAVESVGVCALSELVAWIKGEYSPEYSSWISKEPGSEKKLSLSQVWGQEIAKRAMRVAAAGGHNLLMIGPPGCGKSMLAERFSTLLPKLSDQELLQVLKVHSIAGADLTPILDGQRPFRSPHHSISDAGLVGGGSIPRPGEISLANQGVLFLDELPEFRRSALEALRAPLENGRVEIVRSKASYSFPARFQLLAAMNPCPCGRLGSRAGECLCSQASIQSYLRKLSGPIMDRIDLHVALEPVPVKAMIHTEFRDGSKQQDLEVIAAARERQLKRAGKLNSGLQTNQLGEKLRIADNAVKLLEKSAQKTGLSARAFTRVLKIATTIADLRFGDSVRQADVAEALSYRSLDLINRYIQ